jgi:hypothetical protein
MIKCMERENGKTYTMTEVRNDRFFAAAKFLRLGARGDPARSRMDTYQAIDVARNIWNLPVIGYTHFPEEVPELKTEIMASCSEWEEADELVADGWKVAMDYEFPHSGIKSPDGHQCIWCPNEATKGKVTCGECLLCCTEKESVPIILFKHKLPIWDKRRKKVAVDSGASCET